MNSISAGPKLGRTEAEEDRSQPDIFDVLKEADRLSGRGLGRNEVV